MSIALHRVPWAGLAALALALALPAQARPSGAGHRGHGHLGHAHHHRHSHIGFGLWGGFLFAPAPDPYPWGPAPYPYGGWPSGELPPMAPGRVPVPPPPPAPETVFTPQSGQDATQREVDRRACDRVAMTRADAMADAAVFQRVVVACMQARGYAAPAPAR